MAISNPDFLADLRARGLLQQCTDEPALAAHLRTADLSAGGRRAYVGFDPTSDSLTIGNLVGIVQLARLQRAGHTPVVIMGGGTGFIGDPSGKSAERTLMTPETIAANVASIRGIFERVIDFSPSASNRGLLLDNYDWLGRLSYIHVLRDVGKHFSVNMMIQKESVKERLHNRDQGISYTEFSYMILQAYDYLHLFEKHGVTLQMGGSDQFGNIVCGLDQIKSAGIDRFKVAQSAMNRAQGIENQTERASLEKKAKSLLKKFHKAGHSPGARKEKGSGYDPTVIAGYHWKAFGLTWPLVTKADGGKFGKTESGAVWLSAHRTSPYAFYQFWLNAADADVIRYLRIFSFLSLDEIAALEAAHAADPGKREAHRALARHMTELLHGPTEREHAEAAARALFTGDIAHLPLATLEEALASAPSTEHPRAQLDGPGLPLIDLLAQTTLAKSKSEARTLLSQNSISVNGHKAAADARVSSATLLHGKIIALRRGNKAWHITRWG